MRTRMIAGLSVALFAGTLMASAQTASAAPTPAPAGTHSIAKAASAGQRLSFAQGDRILAELRNELASNRDKTKWVEEITGMAIEPGYTVTELTFRELGSNEGAEESTWRAVMTYVLVDPNGDDRAGGRNLYFDYTSATDRSVTTDAEQYAGNDELPLAPKRSFAQAERELTEWIAQAFPGEDRTFDAVVLRKPIKTPFFENKYPLYVVHIAGDDDQTYYALDTVTGEISEMGV